MSAVKLRGATVLVTGASGGIGRAIALALHRRGAKLLLSARRAAILEELAREVDGEVVVADLATREGVALLCARARTADILVANAALPASGEITDFSEDEIDRSIDVNLRAPVLLARAAVAGMIERGQGQIVFISSLAGKVAPVGGSLYSATKFGVRGFALGLREDLHAHGVGVSVVHPGFIRDAGMFADAGVDLPRGVGTKRPEDVARAVVKCILQNTAEVDVAPFGLRLGTFAGVVAPQLAARVSRRMGAAHVAANLAEGQRDKR